MKDKHAYNLHHQDLHRQISNAVNGYLKVSEKNLFIRLSFKLFVYLSICTICYIEIFSSASLLQLLLAYILFGLFLVLLGFNFAHDFCHNTVFKSKWLNNTCYSIIYTLLGAHAEAWKFRHVHSHHFAPNVKEYDADLNITSLIRVEPGSTYYWFHRFQMVYAPLAYTLYSLYWVFIKDFVIYFTGKDRDAEAGIRFHLYFWIQKILYCFYILFLPMQLLNLEWWWVLLAFISMHLVQSLFLLFTFFITHHVESTSYFETDSNGIINTSWFVNQIKSSNDFYPFSRFANFIFGGFNNHIVHHLFPAIHHIHYPSINRIVYSILLENEIKPNATTFFGGVMSHLKHLRNMGVRDLTDH